MCLVSQVVYSGPLNDAAAYFKEVGFVPDQLRSNVADYMLDSVIRANDDDVADMVDRFSRWTLTHHSTIHQAAAPNAVVSACNAYDMLHDVCATCTLVIQPLVVLNCLALALFASRINQLICI